MKTFFVFFLAVFMLAAGCTSTNSAGTNRTSGINGKIPSIVRIKMIKRKNNTASTNSSAKQTNSHKN